MQLTRLGTARLVDVQRDAEEIQSRFAPFADQAVALQQQSRDLEDAQATVKTDLQDFYRTGAMACDVVKALVEEQKRHVESDVVAPIGRLGDAADVDTLVRQV